MKNSILFSVFALTLFFATHTQGQNVLTDKKMVAVSGYDVVSYFDNQPTKGKPEFTASHENAIYQFASAQNRDKFVANPSKYTPQYGGWCAYGWSKGYPAKIDPQAWTIVDQKLYLNYDTSVKMDWDKDQQGYIKKADANWASRKKKN
jgi:YHS domain-containing protein